MQVKQKIYNDTEFIVTIQYNLSYNSDLSNGHPNSLREGFRLWYQFHSNRLKF